MEKKDDGVTYVGLNELTSWFGGLTSRRVIQMVEDVPRPRLPMKA